MKKEKWKILFLLFLLPVFLSGCCVGKKSKTTTTTLTIYKVDTIVKVKIDTVFKYAEAPLTDTVFIENTVAEARSYYNPTTNKIVLQLRGKVFDVPIKIDAVKKQVVKQKTVEKKIPFVFYILAVFILFVFFGLLCWKKIQDDR